MIKAILFDLDGVLINTTQLQIDSTSEALNPYIKVNNYIKSILKQTITTKEKLKIFNEANYLKKKQLKNIYIEKKKSLKGKLRREKYFLRKFMIFLSI